MKGAISQQTVSFFVGTILLSGLRYRDVARHVVAQAAIGERETHGRSTLRCTSPTPTHRSRSHPHACPAALLWPGSEPVRQLGQQKLLADAKDSFPFCVAIIHLSTCSANRPLPWRL